MSGILSGFNFGLTPGMIGAAGGRVDSYGNVIWTLPSSQTTVGGAGLSTIGSGTPVTSGSSGTSLGSSGSIMDMARSAATQNRNAVGNATRDAAALALESARTLDPYVAERFYENLDRAFPGYRETFSQMTQNTNQMLQGRVPDDVADMVRMYSAEQGIQGHHANTARNLGLTSLDMAQKGFTQGESLFDLASKYLTPPVGDVYASAEGIRRDLVDVGTLRPADAINAALTKRGQDINQQQFSTQMSFERDKLKLQADMFQAEYDWNARADALNRAWAREQQALTTKATERIVAAREAETAAMKSKFDEILSTLKR